MRVYHPQGHEQCSSCASPRSGSHASRANLVGLLLKGPKVPFTSIHSRRGFHRQARPIGSVQVAHGKNTGTESILLPTARLARFTAR